MTFPISTVDQRELPDDWSGDVFTCDIDRTYLMTRFSSLKGLARIPFEFAVDKRAIEGMTTLLKEIRRGPDQRSRQTPLFFVSASPAQLRPVIERKMLLDGLEFDGTTFKDWLGVVRAWRMQRFREQLGFKLTALLSRRATLPAGARETLIGDDLERDADVFALYADVLAGRIRGEALLSLLARHGVADDDAGAIAALIRTVGEHPEGVRRAYIRLERGAADDFIDRAPRLVACSGPLQMALSLWAERSISLEGLVRVGLELAARSGPGSRQLAPGLDEQLADACRRGLLAAGQAIDARAALAHAGLLNGQADAGSRLPPVDPRWAAQIGCDARPWSPPGLHDPSPRSQGTGRS